MDLAKLRLKIMKEYQLNKLNWLYNYDYSSKAINNGTAVYFRRYVRIGK